MLTNKDIVCLSPIDWDFLWQRHQVLMTMFASAGNRVFYVENLHPSPRITAAFIPRALKRLCRIAGRGPQAYKHESITLISPFVLPFKGPLSVSLNNTICLPLLTRKLRALGVHQPVLWTYLATSSVLRIIDAISPRSIVYDCVSDAGTHPDSPPDIQASENELVRKASVIFTDNTYHFNRNRILNPRTYIVPPGVDYARFSSVPHSACTGNKKRPQLCFFGGINDLRMDFGLIRHIAVNRPSWEIVLYGPVVKCDIESLRLPNITFAGTVKHEELPGRLGTVDVFILPYKRIPFTQSVFPAKTFECLATGKPVVATPIDELRQFDGVFALASDGAGFIQAIEHALTHDTTERCEKRRAIAKDNSWEKRFATMNEQLEEV